MGTVLQIQEKAKELGFDEVAFVDPQCLVFRPEVRDMCAVDRCHKYGKSWDCPPACGTLEELGERASGYQYGLVVQTWGALEDDFDVDTMDALSALQKKRFAQFAEFLRDNTELPMPMGSGSCILCEQCTYPDAPCRFPDKVTPSMEACGLLVTQVCEQANIPYYHGKQTLAFTSCALFNLD